VPSELAGSWRRTIDTTGAPAAGSAGNPTDTFTPSGTYTITFEKQWILDHFPGAFTAASQDTGAGWEITSDWTPGPTMLHVQGAVTFKVSNDSDQLGGWWCEPGGPAADYSW